MRVCKNKKHSHSVVVFSGPVACPIYEYQKTIVRERRYSRKLEVKLESVGCKPFLQKINPHK